VSFVVPLSDYKYRFVCFSSDKNRPLFFQKKQNVRKFFVIFFVALFFCCIFAIGNNETLETKT